MQTTWDFKSIRLRDPQLCRDYLSSDNLDLEILVGALASRRDPEAAWEISENNTKFCAVHIIEKNWLSLGQDRLDILQIEWSQHHRTSCHWRLWTLSQVEPLKSSALEVNWADNLAFWNNLSHLCGELLDCGQVLQCVKLAIGPSRIFLHSLFVFRIIVKRLHSWAMQN